MPTFLRADPRRRSTVRFPSAGEDLAGHLYRPSADGATAAAVAMCGPISSVKEQTLPHYAELLADAGYTVLTFDPRGFGESSGEPRHRYDPWAVIEDFHSAVSHLLTRDDVDPERVAAVGVCMGGGYAVSLGARDKRLRAVVAIAGGYDIGTTFQLGFGADGFAAYVRRINDLVQEQYVDGEIRYIPTIAHGLDEQTPIAAMPNEEAYAYYDRTSRDEAPSWPRELTADSLPAYFAYNAVAAAPLVAPIPLGGRRGDVLRTGGSRLHVAQRRRAGDTRAGRDRRGVEGEPQPARVDPSPDRQRRDRARRRRRDGGRARDRDARRRRLGGRPPVDGRRSLRPAGPARAGGLADRRAEADRALGDRQRGDHA
jgi:fermentation-respiration switch protein FrsA (DUF1100 family)